MTYSVQFFDEIINDIQKAKYGIKVKEMAWR